MLVVCRFDTFKRFVTDSVFYPASVLLCGFLIYASGDKLFCEKQVTLIDFFGDLPAYIGQMKKAVFVHSQKTAVTQDTYRVADTRFAESHVSGKVYGAHHALFLFQYQHSSK
jgi:hypothetical protein